MVSVARCPFCEQDYRDAASDALDDFGHRVASLIAARAINKHRPLHFGCNTDQGPARDFALRNKGDWHNRTDYENVCPGYMVRHEQHGAAAYRSANDTHMDPQERAEHAIVVRRYETPTGQIEFVEQPLNGDQYWRHREEECRNEKRAQH